VEYAAKEEVAAEVGNDGLEFMLSSPLFERNLGGEVEMAKGSTA
jgi:hypothetical protein